jgi:hypothetical protein
MGRELKLQAIIENSELVEIARVNEEFADLLSFFSKTAQALMLFPGQEDDISMQFLECCVLDFLESYDNLGV